jgi:hypothetical protein
VRNIRQTPFDKIVDRISFSTAYIKNKFNVKNFIEFEVLVYKYDFFDFFIYRLSQYLDLSFLLLGSSF